MTTKCLTKEDNYLILSIIALNKSYNNLIQKYGIDHNTFVEKILSVKSDAIPEKEILLRTLTSIAIRGPLKFYEQGNYYVWDFFVTPTQYFNKKIKPNLSPEKLNELEKLAISLG